MENEDQEFWKGLLTNRNLRSRFIRELEIQAISSRSTDDLATRYRDEEMLRRNQVLSVQSAASIRSW